MSNIRNLRTISDQQFLDEMTSAMLAAIDKGGITGNALAAHWAGNAASFAVSSGLLESFTAQGRRFANWIRDVVMHDPEVTAIDWQTEIE